MAYISLGVLVMQNSLLALLMRYSRTMAGDLYLASTAVVVCEVLKLLVSVYLLLQEEGPGRSAWDVMRFKVFHDPYDLARLMVPAGLYTVEAPPPAA